MKPRNDLLDSLALAVLVAAGTLFIVAVLGPWFV